MLIPKRKPKQLANVNTRIITILKPFEALISGFIGSSHYTINNIPNKLYIASTKQNTATAAHDIKK